jgi:hypothetical protein
MTCSVMPQAELDELLNHQNIEALTEWERLFLTQMSAQSFPVTDGQRSVLTSIRLSLARWGAAPASLAGGA